jgi:regulator of sigma E protease
VITVITFIVVFGLIIFVHELGHFVAAKSLGVGVKKFAFGFPPKLWSKKYKGTEYAINLIPLGGYVKLEGEFDDLEEVETFIVEEEKKPRQSRKRSGKLFEQHPLGLIMIFSAGVLMNMVTAVILIWLCFMIGFKPIGLGQFSQKIYPGIDGSSGVTSTMAVKIDEVEKGTPAETNGLMSGDIIVKVDGENIYFADEVINTVQSKINDDGAKVDVVVRREGALIEKNLSTYRSKIKGSNGEEYETNRIGIVLSTEGTLKTDPINAFKVAIISTGNIAKYTIIGLVDFFVKIFTQFNLSENVVGPIGLVVTTNYFAHLGLSAIVQFAAILSVSVALFNILPIPALDGGYVAFTLIEVVTRRKISLKTKSVINLVGFAALISLMIVVTFKDFVTFGVSQYILKLFGS